MQATLSHYRVLEQIGEGGMGVVYRAHDERLDRDVALKVLPSGALADEAARKRFKKEALALSRLNHPNIATVFDFDTQEGMDFLVEEFIPGHSLHELVATGALPEHDILHLGVQICEGLATAHEQGIIHRDLKPANIRVMPTPDQRVKILDFGLAKMLPKASVGSDDVTATFSETQSVAGTLPYMAPEQVMNERLDARTDIWALGCVLYEMATGRRPFSGSGITLADQIRQQQPTAPAKVNAKVSPGLEAIILKCLEKDPGRRYASTRDIAVALRQLETGVVPRAQRERQRRAAWRTATAVVVVVVFAVAGFFIYRWLLPTARPIRSIAVLPLANLSGDPAQEFFADGMTDALIADLAQIKAVKVISRTSVMHYKGTSETLPQIARELGVDGIVEASVLRSGGRVRLTAQLIDTRQDRHLWANNYERNMTDVLALQSELVQTIAGEIRAQLTPRESERLRTTRRIDPEVYDTTLKGKATMEYATREEQIRQAIELFQKAVDRDPTYAPAWAGLAEGLWSLAATGEEFVAPAEVRDKAIAAADRALELDPNLPDAHKARAVIALDAEWDLAKAQWHFERALELRPSYAAAHNLYSQMLHSPLQRIDESRRHLDQARELDPLSPWNDVNLVAWWLFQGRPGKALEESGRARQRNPTLWIVPWLMGFARLSLGQPSQAASELEAALKLLQPERPAAVLGALGQAYGLAGRQADALNILAEMEQASASHYISPYYLAAVYSGLGRMDEAFRHLDRALAQRTPYLYLVVSTRDDPLSVALRRDPRWKHFIARLRQQVRLPPGTADPYS